MIGGECAHALTALDAALYGIEFTKGWAIIATGAAILFFLMWRVTGRPR